MVENPDEDRPADPASLSALFASAHRGAPGRDCTDALFSTLYHELRRIARRELHRTGPPFALSATTLLHETYLDLSSRGVSFPDRARFFAYAARAMRGLIVSHARQCRAVKRGGQFHFTSFDATGAPEIATAQRLEPLCDALDALAEAEPALAELVELKYFGGFELAEIASLRGVNERTVQRHWDKARAFLKHAIDAD
jgi:RNA polymerase sigma factor (TIGR02999 family)